MWTKGVRELIKRPIGRELAIEVIGKPVDGEFTARFVGEGG